VGALIRGEPLARHTSFGIGGPAGWFVAAETAADLRRWLDWGRERGWPITLLGHGSNVLVADAGLRGLVIVNRWSGVRWSRANWQFALQVGSGTPLSDLAYYTVSRGRAGLEWAVGIPGTVGGAVVGNAGAFGGYMGDVVRRVTVLEADGRVRELTAEECGFEYRTSAFKAGAVAGVILDVELALRPGDPRELWAKAEEGNARRDATQPREPSAGSVFKRTANHPAGWLIEQAGLKGTCKGDACISPVHANFIVNRGQATAADVRFLIELAQRRVREQFGEELELEIERIGAW
jgi:UDP-N-acetylmuramate dehydrogenase